MLRGSALTARVRSGKKERGGKNSINATEKRKRVQGAKPSPAMLMLAGVAFRDAGVLVRLLLLGVMPLGVERCYFISRYTK